MSSSAISAMSTTSCEILISVAAIGIEVGRRPVAIALQQPIDPGARHQLAGEMQVERRQRQRPVVDHLDRGAAVAEQQHRAELPVGGDPDDQLVGAAGGGSSAARVRPSSLASGARRARRARAWRAGSLCTWPARPDRARRRRRRICAGCPARRSSGPPGRRSPRRSAAASCGARRQPSVGTTGMPYAARISLPSTSVSQLRPAASAAAMIACAAAVSGSQLLGERGRRLHQDFLIAPVGDHLHEGADRVFGRVVGRNVVLGEQLPCLDARRDRRASSSAPAGACAWRPPRPRPAPRRWATVTAVGQLRTTTPSTPVVLHDERRAPRHSALPGRRR